MYSRGSTCHVWFRAIAFYHLGTCYHMKTSPSSTHEGSGSKEEGKMDISQTTVSISQWLQITHWEKSLGLKLIEKKEKMESYMLSLKFIYDYPIFSHFIPCLLCNNFMKFMKCSKSFLRGLKEIDRVGSSDLKNIQFHNRNSQAWFPMALVTAYQGNLFHTENINSSYFL